jgi:hypothetical protein
LPINIIRLIKLKGKDGRGASKHAKYMASAYNALDEKPEGKRQLGRCRCRWKKILKWILMEQA